MVNFYSVTNSSMYRTFYWLMFSVRSKYTGDVQHWSTPS